MSEEQQNLPEAQSKAESTSAPTTVWNQKLAEIMIQCVLGGGVGLGGFFALLGQSDLPKLALGGVLGGSAPIAYALVEPMIKKTKKGAGYVGEGAADFAEEAAKGVVDKVLGKDDRYLELQKEDCQTSHCDGISQVFTPLLDEIFVPLSMTFTDRSPGWQREQAGELDEARETAVLMPSSQKEAQIWKWLKQAEKDAKQGLVFRRMAILATGGYGKTTLLKHIAYIYSSKQHRRYEVSARFPIFLSLKTYGKLVAATPSLTLPEVVMKHHVPYLSRELDLPENWALSKLKSGEAVLLLDGLDEVKESIRPQLSQWLKRELREYPKSIAILTSRPKAYDDQPIATKLDMRMRIWVESFNREQQEAFIKRWYSYQEQYANNGRSTSDVTRNAAEKAEKLLGQIRERPEIEDLAKVPLLLNMIATFHRTSPNVQLPKRKVDLYQAICKLQLVDRPGAKELVLRGVSYPSSRISYDVA